MGMTDDELQAIKARHDRFKSNAATYFGWLDDIAALLAEVERLRKGRDWALDKLGDMALEKSND